MSKSQTILAIQPGARNWWESIDRVVEYPISMSSNQSPESIYLRHIVDHYDELTSPVVFLHSDAPQYCRDVRERIDHVPADAAYYPLGQEIRVETTEPSHAAMLDQVLRTQPVAEAPQFATYHLGSLFSCSPSCIRARPVDVYRRALRLAEHSPQGTQFLESNWHRIFDSSALRRGVVTAADANLFRDLQFMIQSLRSVDDIPLVVYDLGLRHEQLQWCLQHNNVTCRPLPPMSDSLAAYVGQHRWQAWLKPTYIHDAPFDQLLWIDADCVILSPLDEAFQQLQDGPLLMPEVAVGCGANHADLYTTHLPIRDPQRRGKAEMNNGVIGLDRRRDRELIDAWLYVVQWAVEHPELRHLIRWYDQGALLWAILRTENDSNIRDCHNWNYPANADGHLIASASENGASIVAAIRAKHPDARIVHWFGLIKLSVALNDEITRMFAADVARRSPL